MTDPARSRVLQVTDPIATWAVVLVDDERHVAIEALVHLAGGRRLPLEAAHLVLVRRLHWFSDDFEGTKALQLVIGALGSVDRIPRPTIRKPTAWRRGRVRPRTLHEAPLPEHEHPDRSRGLVRTPARAGGPHADHGRPNRRAGAAWQILADAMPRPGPS